MQRVERNEPQDFPVFFVLGVDYMSLDQLQGLFDFDFYLIEFRNGFPVEESQKQITIEPCTVSHLQTVFDNETANTLFTRY